MTASPRENQHANLILLHIPFRIVQRGGRKEMQLLDGAVNPLRSDNTLVKALARAFKWKRLLESSEFSSAGDLAERERIAPSYLTRILQLTLLAPNIFEEMLVHLCEGEQRRATAEGGRP